MLQPVRPGRLPAARTAPRRGQDGAAPGPSHRRQGTRFTPANGKGRELVPLPAQLFVPRPSPRRARPGEPWEGRDWPPALELWGARRETPAFWGALAQRSCTPGPGSDAGWNRTGPGSSGPLSCSRPIFLQLGRGGGLPAPLPAPAGIGASPTSGLLQGTWSAGSCPWAEQQLHVTDSWDGKFKTLADFLAIATGPWCGGRLWALARPSRAAGRPPAAGFSALPLKHLCPCWRGGCGRRFPPPALSSAVARSLRRPVAGK